MTRRLWNAVWYYAFARWHHLKAFATGTYKRERERETEMDRQRGELGGEGRRGRGGRETRGETEKEGDVTEREGQGRTAEVLNRLAFK